MTAASAGMQLWTKEKAKSLQSLMPTLLLENRNTTRHWEDVKGGQLEEEEEKSKEEEE